MSDQPGVPLKYLVRANPRPSASLSGQTATYIPMEAIHEFAGVDVELSRPSEELSQGYSYIENGDVAYAKVTPCFENGKGFVARNLPEGRAFATTEVTVLRPGNGISTEYLGWLLQSEDFKSRATAAMTGAGGLKRVPESFTLGFRVPLTEVVHQQAIADFLDRETAEIDEFVAESEKLITLLNERRAAVITQAVTNGLDPTAPMKDTRIEWLGQVPAHWKLEAARSVVSDENHKNQLGQDAFYLSLVAGRGVMPYAEKGDIGNKMPEDLSRCKVVARGDLVINSMNYGIGSYGVSKFDGVCSPVYIVLRPKPSMDIRYVERIFECRPFQRLAQSFGNGILEHRRAINWDTLKSLRVPVPPAEEQKQIEESIRLRTAKIDEAIATAREAIALAKERRQALISAAVTGKIDVRAAA